MSGHNLRQTRYYLQLVNGLSRLFSGLREASGDTAYERYVQHCRQHHPDSVPLGRKAFYDLRLQQKWSGISRCC